MKACDVGRERIHALLDEGAGAPMPMPLSEHLDACPGCRELHDDLIAVQRALRARGVPSFPEESLESVWDETVRAPRTRLSGGRRAALAAALVTGVATATLWMLRTPEPPAGPTAAEIARAEAQADLVLAYAARALAATRVAATERVVASKISPAVRGDVPAEPRRN